MNKSEALHQGSVEDPKVAALRAQWLWDNSWIWKKHKIKIQL